MKKILALTAFLLSPTFSAISQSIAKTDSVAKPIIKLSFLDSLKSTYVIDEMTSCVDDRWLKELSNAEVFNELSSDIKNINLDQPVDYELSTDLFKERLRLLDEKSPFNIEYNVGLENLVKSFLKNRKRSFERLMGISQYYFPIFEEAMARHNVPLEIKYLALVESALNPKAVSRVGATGLWQFMFQTGKQYGLKIDSYVDERSDVLKASDAAARYMSGMFSIFGDWELVLASYNSGAGNVNKAIRRSGGYNNFWNIKKHLPKETQGYVPAFLAYMYIFEYHKEHGLVPNKAVANHFATDTVAVKRKMTFKQIAQLLDITESQLDFLNPSYKTKVIPYVTNQVNYLCLPKDKIAIFTRNEDKMYAYIDYQERNREKPFAVKPKAVQATIGTLAIVPVTKKDTAITQTPIQYHIVKKGQNLASIAREYQVSLSEIKKWNKIKGGNVTIGKKLQLLQTNTINITTEDKPVINDKPMVYTEKQKYKKAKKTAVVLTDTKKTDQEITKKTQPITQYTIQPGETLMAIAQKNRLYVSDLKKWNNLSSTNIEAGQKLRLTAPTADETTVNTTDNTLYTVKKGDNIYMIARNNNINIEDIKDWNNLDNNNLKIGDQLKIKNNLTAKQSKKISQAQHLYIVQKGDSLFSISQKLKKSVAEIKKQNNLKDEGIVPGMKLKV